MKKFLSLMMMTLLCAAAWAGTVTLKYSGSTTNMTGGNDAALVNLSATDWSVVGAKGGNNNYPGLNKDGTIRLYWSESDGNTLTVTAQNGNTIDNISIEYKTGYDNGRVRILGQIDAAKNEDGSYKINASSFTVLNYNTSNVQVHIKSITINYTESTNTLKAPTILINGETPAASYSQADLPLKLSITSNNGTETPRYQYTFNNPELAISPVHSGETSLELGENEVLNLKLGSNTLSVFETIRNEDNTYNDSPVASVTFTVNAAVNNVAEFLALDEGTQARFDGNVTVLATAGRYLYTQDSEKGLLIYLPYGQTADYTFGDIIPAGFTGTRTAYSGAPQMGNPSGLAAATGNAQPNPIAITPSGVTLDNYSRYAVIQGATIANGEIIVGEESVTIYNDRFKVTIPADGATYDVYGIVDYHNGEQFMPLEFVKVEEPVEVSLNVTPQPVQGQTFTEPVTVTITPVGFPEDAEVMISYKLNDGEEWDYTSPFTLYNTTTVYAYATDGDNEAEWTGTYTIEIPLTLTANPEPGTYTGAQDVTVTVGNAQYDVDLMWTFTPEGATEPIAEDLEVMGFNYTVTQSGTLYVYAVEQGNTGREVEQSFVYVINEPVTLDGMIVFADANADDSTDLTADGLIGQIEKGAEYIDEVTAISKVYAGATGLKFGSSKASGNLSFNLTDTWNATKITVIAKNYGNDQTTMTVNGEQFELTGEFAKYEVAFPAATELDNITISTNKRAYVKVIDIEGTKVVKPISVTFSPDGGTFYKPVEVTLTAENLPEDAVVKYSILDEDEEFVVMDEVYTEPFMMFQSGYIMAVVYGPNNTYLYDTESEDFIINRPEITVTPDFGEYEGTQTVFVTVENMPQDAVIEYYFVAAETENAPRRAEGELTWTAYDEAAGIEVAESGLLTIRVSDAEGDEIAGTEGEYVITKPVTGIEALMAAKPVAGVRYYNAVGQGSDKAFEGMNIVVVSYQDGTQAVTKVVK